MQIGLGAIEIVGYILTRQEKGIQKEDMTWWWPYSGYQWLQANA